MAKARTGRDTPAVTARPSDALSRERKLELYYWMKLTRGESAAQRGQDEPQNLD